MPTLTRIQGSIYDPLGAAITTGTISMSLQQDMISVDGTKVAPFTVSQDLSLVGGVFDKSVYATVGATPGGLAYLVEYDPDPADVSVPPHLKNGYWRNWWSVPNTTNVPIGNFVSAHRGDPYANYMPLGGTLVSSGFPDTTTIGTVASTSNKLLVANQVLGGPNPTIRWNHGSTYWDLSVDGTAFTRMVVGTGSAGKLTKWSAAGVLADSIISESGSIASIANTLSVPNLTSAGDLTITPTADIIVGKDIIPATALAQNLGTSGRKFGTIWASELRLDTLVAADTLATVGGRLMVAETTNLTADLNGAVTLAFLKHNFPTKDDIFFMEESGTKEWLKIDSFAIVAVSTGSEWIEISGDYTALFTAGRLFQVRSSTGNNGSWTVSSAAYQAGTVRTRITVTGNITNATADGHIAYLDAGPYLFPVVRNLEGGSDAWKSGDALLNTAESYLDLYSTTSSIGSGLGPTMVGYVRTGLTYTNLSPRFAIGNLNGHYGYVTNLYGVAMGDPAGSWVKIDATNGVRLGYDTTTHGTLSSTGLLFGSVLLNDTGLFISPVAAGGGGAYANTNAVRWSTDTTYRTAIWRSDDTGGSPVKWLNIDSINDHNTVITHLDLTASNKSSGADAYGTAAMKLTGTTNMGSAAALISKGTNGSGSFYDAWVYTSAINSPGGFIEIGLGVAPAMGSSLLTGGSSVTASIRLISASLEVKAQIEQVTGKYIYPGSASGLSDYQTSYYIASHATWGLYTNTAFYANGNFVSNSALKIATNGGALEIMNAAASAFLATIAVDASNRTTILCNGNFLRIAANTGGALSAAIPGTVAYINVEIDGLGSCKIPLYT
jgi:hypothetical protein